MRALTIWVLLLLPSLTLADGLVPVSVTEWKSVYGRIEARDRVPARARIGGTLVDLAVVEGDIVAAGQVLGRVTDDKLALQMQAVAAQESALNAQLTNARTELQRGEDLLARGVATAQRLDALRTQVDVLIGQIAAVVAQRLVIEQQSAEGAILAPVAGRILDVLVSRGSVLLPGEAAAVIGGGGIFLRLAIPERHARALTEGDALAIEGPEGQVEGLLAKIYPLIENGRVVADVEVKDLSDRYVDARVLVRVPVGSRQALMVPQVVVERQGGLDFVATTGGFRTVVPGETHLIDGEQMIEILSGLVAGDVLAKGSK
jgi:RND family efflux transporter MFP subunit